MASTGNEATQSGKLSSFATVWASEDREGMLSRTYTGQRNGSEALQAAMQVAGCSRRWQGLSGVTVNQRLSTTVRLGFRDRHCLNGRRNRDAAIAAALALPKYWKEWWRDHVPAEVVHHLFADLVRGWPLRDGALRETTMAPVITPELLGVNCSGRVVPKVKGLRGSTWHTTWLRRLTRFLLLREGTDPWLEWQPATPATSSSRSQQQPSQRPRKRWHAAGLARRTDQW